MPKRIEKIEQKNGENLNDLGKIKRLTIKINTENLQKEIIEIPIITDYLIGDGTGGGIGG